MTGFQEQLAFLRQKVAHIDQKYSAERTQFSAPPRPGNLVEELLSGEVVENASGAHFQTERLYESHRRHGSMDISSLIELPETILDALSEGAIAQSHPTRWAFLDTETTGLAGGTGTYAFLIGVGSIDSEGFRIRQFFMRDYGEDRSQLAALEQYLERFDVLITYNGKAFDQPLLETRFRMMRSRPPFGRMQHLDLLHGARRLWKLRLASCRLVELENQILGVERQGDLPGEMIPYYYFEYLRMRQAFRLVPIFHHNAIDILTLACLTAIVPAAFRAPEEMPARHGADLVGLARWLARADRHEQALGLLRRAVDLGMPDDLLFPSLVEIGLLEKKLGRDAEAVAVFTDLTASPNRSRGRAYQELAKHYEHRERNYSLALEMTQGALALDDSQENRHREDRLRTRLVKASKPKPPRRRK